LLPEPAPLRGAEPHERLDPAGTDADSTSRELGVMRGSLDRGRAAPMQSYHLSLVVQTSLSDEPVRRDPAARVRAREEPMSEPTVTIQGVAVPRIGFSAAELPLETDPSGRVCYEVVCDVLRIGYRHIDIARVDDSRRATIEPQVGQAMLSSGVPREEIFLTTSIRRKDLEQARGAGPEYSGRGDLRDPVRRSLSNLETDYVDLLLLPWPDPNLVPDWRFGWLLQLREEGMARQVGVSNFPPRQLRLLLEVWPVFCHQIEYHPYLAQPQLLALAAEHDMLVTAYEPLAQNRVRYDPVVAAIAQAHGVTPAQVGLRWLLQQPNVVPLCTPPAGPAGHNDRVAYLDVFGFSLTDDEMAQISALDQGLRLNNPPWAPDWDDSTAPTTAPLLRVFNPTSGDHFYTTSVAERDNAVANGGYRDEGVACHVFPSQ
jgi:2,5-diketo-D-gluconate reductase B